MATTEPSEAGKDLIECWHRAKMHKRDLERKLTTATNDAEVAEKALADWLLPPDAKANEKFCMWYGDTLIQVWHENLIKHVEIRTQGRDLQ
jgi:hypothetical protein